MFLETGCTDRKPKNFNTKWKICQNNPADDIKNSHIHNGKGTIIIKKKQ